jgi:hypothetical protein
MKKELVVMDEKKGIVQITTCDERWYSFENKNKDTGLPEYGFIPSVTWICEFYPKGIAFYKWLANKGWDEAESLKTAAGDKGSKVHHAIGDLLEGKAVKMGDIYNNPTTDMPEALTAEEYECILSFVDWFETTNPTILSREFVVVNKQESYAGTVDMLCEIFGECYLIDLKTSPNIWPSHELQVSAYKHADFPSGLPTPNKLAILQLGYKRNKIKKYKFTEIEDQYDEFLAAKLIWAKETKGVEPKQRDYPLEIKLELNKEKQNA